jgi:hypothetical protein
VSVGSGDDGLEYVSWKGSRTRATSTRSSAARATPSVRLFLRDPKEDVTLSPGETYTVRPGRPHLVTNAGPTSTTFLVLQGIGEYDYVPLV